MSSDIERTLIEKVKSLPPERQREALVILEKLTSTPAAAGADKTIWEEIDEVVEGAPPGTWDSVPADGADNIDHYLYGTPRK